MHRLAPSCLLSLLFTLPTLAAPPALSPTDPGQPQLRKLQVAKRPSGGTLQLEGPLPSMTKVWLHDEAKPIEFTFNKDATEISLHLPSDSESPADILFLITEKSITHPDGAVVLSALDSTVVGTQAKLETHPGNHRIGFWGNAADLVRWDFPIPAGSYQVELTYSRASSTGTEVAIAFDDTILPHTLETTGSWYRYRTVPIGTVSITKASSHRIETRVTKIVNGGVMNLKALILTPISGK